MSSSEELYTAGTRVWIPDPETVWRGAKVVKDYKSGDKQLLVKSEDGDEVNLKLTASSPSSPLNLPPLRNPEILVGENDLTALSHLHEPAVLHNLAVRFLNQNTIYTYCGIVLVAINPYFDLPIYDADTIEAYMGQDMGSLDPHIFAVTEEAYKNMARFERNQSIIVSGESGAGKTVSAKYAMRYFASVGGSQTETQIEKKVLASSPIMEAIGNAKTTRNDNSSRFGKYIEINFNSQNFIVGSSMRTYLLEKSRVVYQAPDERNYHIFYQLCASHDLPEFAPFKLMPSSQFEFTNQGRNSVISGVDDANDLAATRQAFSLLGINEIEQMSIFRVLAAILHLGNIEIGGNDHAEIYSDDDSLLAFCSLMGVELDTMSLWLINRKISTVNDTMIKALNPREAKFSRDALAKHIYSCLFNWIVTKLNKALTGESKQGKFIGVLDIYGFETFETNSFEQFCINYANEKLQQQFNQHVFKLEQEEYVAEGINWSMIDFYDNQPCINLIESKLGILDLLDEECRMPSGSDAQWCLKLYDKHGGGKKFHFEKPRMSNVSFIIKHFADNVDYSSKGFLEKNRDAVQEEQLNVLKSAKFSLISDLLQQDHLMTPSPSTARGGGVGGLNTPIKSRSGHHMTRTAGGMSIGNAVGSPMKGTKLQKKTVGSQFRDSLNELMDTLTATEPHYVRCIKPNDDKASFSFDEKRAVQQLRACGVLETVRISAAGYPSRWTYAEFFSRYRVLIESSLIDREDLRKTCEIVLKKLIEKSGGIVADDKFQFGKTKIFFRAGQVAYLEKLRSDRLRACGVMIQKHVRGWIAKQRYRKVRRTVALVQRYGRALLAKNALRRLREDKAATKIQAVARGFFQRRRYAKVRRAVKMIQAHARGMKARKTYHTLVRERAATCLQKNVRRFMCRRRYDKIRAGLIAIQAHARRKRAAKELQRLRTEAKSMDHLKKLNKGLENKIIELQQKITEQAKLQVAFAKKDLLIKELECRVESLKESKTEAQKWSQQVADLEAEIQKLKTENENLISEKADLSYEKDLAERDAAEVAEELRRENVVVNEEKEKLAADLEQFKVESVEDQKEALQQAKRDWEKAHEDELARYQKLLGDYNRLEQRYENVQEDLQLFRNGGSKRTKIESEGDGAAEAHAERPLETGEVEVKQEGEHGDVDMGLMIRLQNRLKALESERDNLKSVVDESRQRDATPIESSAADSVRLQETERENVKLKDQLREYRKAIVNSNEFEQLLASGSYCGKEVNNNSNEEVNKNNNTLVESANMTEASRAMLRQFDSMKEELMRRSEECVELKTMLAERAMDQALVAQESYGGKPEILNEDGELAIAYRAEKSTNKVLNEQINKKDKTVKELQKKAEKLQQELDEKQQLMTSTLDGKAANSTEAMLLHQNQMLTGENLDLKEKTDELASQCEKYKKTIKAMAKRQATGSGGGNASAAAGHGDDDVAAADASGASAAAAASNRSPAGVVGANILRKETEFKGMFSYPRESEPMLIKNLILELKPKISANLHPGLPAYVIFMCIRHTDYTNDDNKLKSLLSGTVNSIKRVVKRFTDDAERTTLWLANTCRLLHNLKQYSGDKAFQKDNNAKQKEQCLRNFDLSEYRQVLADLAVWIYQGLIRIIEAKIQSYIITAVLENEAISGLSQTKPVGIGNRASSKDNCLGGTSKGIGGKGVNSGVAGSSKTSSSSSKSLDALVHFLNQYLKMMTVHGVDQDIINQVFKQTFYYIGASCLNNLLLRKEMCHWSRGMQIRFNLSHLEQWINENGLQASEAVATLQPIVQASQLLQSRKELEDVEAVCETCSRLSAPQIVKILNLYTPNNEFEGRVSIIFIRAVQERLQARDKKSAEPGGEDFDVLMKNTLLMDTRFTFPVRFPFCSSAIALEEIVVPESVNLPFLKRI